MTTDSSTHVVDVDQAQFQSEVIDRSHYQPVVVDFWAAWCGPCRTLGPMIEEAVSERGGAARLAKVDVDRNQQIAMQYGVQGIPAVKGFRDGKVVAEFTGAVPRAQIEMFLDQLIPSRADELVSQAGATTDPDLAVSIYREALAIEPAHRDATVGLAELMVEQDPEGALSLVGPHRPDSRAEAVAARAELALNGGGDEASLVARVEADPDDSEARLLLGRLLASRGEYEAAAEHLLTAVRAGGETREPAREYLVTMFTVLGSDHELVSRLRPKLANALF